MEWTQERVEALFNSVEENQHLDYKAGKFFNDDFTDSLTKFVTGFANSDGGVLLVGVEEGRKEEKVYAVGFWPFDGTKWNREKIEALIDQHISPRIPGIKIHPIRLDGDIGRSVYAIEVPKSENCHQASDNRYYYRLDTSTRAMKDFQIRDVMNRRKHSNLKLALIVSRMENISLNIRNDGAVVSKNWSLIVIFPESALKFVIRGSSEKPYLGESYKGVRSARASLADLVDIKSGRVSEIINLPCHIFHYNKTSLARSEIIFPRSMMEVGAYTVDYIDEEKLICYWPDYPSKRGVSFANARQDAVEG